MLILGLVISLIVLWFGLENSNDWYFGGFARLLGMLGLASSVIFALKLIWS